MQIPNIFKLKPIALTIKDSIKPRNSIIRKNSNLVIPFLVIGVLTFSSHQAKAESFPSPGTTKTYDNPGDSEINGNESRLVLDGDDPTTMNIDGITLNILSFNSGFDDGGAISITDAMININTLNSGGVSFSNNTSENSGGVIFNSSGSTFTIGNNASFSNNSAGFNGGAINNTGATFAIGNNASFSDNSSGFSSGGAINNTGNASFTIGNDASFSNNSAGAGGAINSFGSTFRIGSNASFNFNNSENGGAISTFNSTLEIGSNASFDSNASNNRGGAIENSNSTFTIDDEASFSNNSADGTGGSGGAIDNSRNSTFIIGNGANFNSNTSQNSRGGAIENNSSTFIIGDNASFSNNSAGGTGGAGGAISNINSGSTFTIGNNVSFSGNSAGSNGGAIHHTSSGSTFTIGNGASFNNNSANFNGGAISNFRSFIIGNNANFSGNSAVGNGGAIYNDSGSTLTFLLDDGTTTKFTGNTDNTGANSITFGNGNSTLNINTGNSGSSNTALLDMQDPMRASGVTININKNDDGNWALGGTNNFTLASRTNIHLNSGKLYLYATDEVATGAGRLNLEGTDAGTTSMFVLASNASLVAGGDNIISLGTGTITVEDGATIRGGSASQSLGGNTPFNETGGTTSLDLSANTGTRLEGVLNLEALDASDNFTLKATLVDGSGAGRIVKNGDGTVVLTQVNTYTGDTDIISGTLMLGMNGSIAESERVTIHSGATLDTSANTETSINNLNGNAGAALKIGTSSLDLNINADSQYSGAFTGGGDLKKEGSASFFVDGNSPLFVGDLFINDGVLTVNGNLGNTSSATVANGATLKGVGTLRNLTINGTIAPGNSIDTLSVNDNYVQNSGSTYEVEINPNGNSDLIDITGTATINGGTISVIKEPGIYTPQRYTILTADDGRSGTYDNIIQMMPFLNFELVYDANNVYLEIVRSAKSFATLAETRNEIATANAVESLGLGNPVFNAILNIENATQERRALNALSGEPYASILSAFTEDSRYARQATLNRLDDALSSSAHNPTLASLYAKATSNKVYEAQNRTLWMHAYGAWGDIKGNGNAAELTRDNKGIIVGADKRVGENVVGLLGGYSNSHMDVDARASGAKSDDYSLGLYAGRNINNWFAKIGGVYTWHQLEVNRTASFPNFFNELKSAYTSHTAQIFGELDYDLSLTAMMLKPFMNAAYVYSDTGRWQEHGGAAALMGDNDFDVFYTSLGIKQAMHLLKTNSKVISESATLAWRHAFGNTAPVSRFQFVAGGIPLGIQGAPIAENSLLVDAGINMDVAPKNLTLRLAYIGQFADKVQDHGATGTVRWKFD